MDDFYFQYISEKRSENIKDYLDNLKVPNSIMLPPGLNVQGGLVPNNNNQTTKDSIQPHNSSNSVQGNHQTGKLPNINNSHSATPSNSNPNQPMMKNMFPMNMAQMNNFPMNTKMPNNNMNFYHQQMMMNQFNQSMNMGKFPPKFPQNSKILI